MKKRANKLLSVILVAALLLALAPTTTLGSSGTGDMRIHGTITWHGGDPSAVAILLNTKSDNYGIYIDTQISYNNSYYNVGNPQLYLSPATYIGNGEWKLDYELRFFYLHDDLPFVGISESSLTGKWYCNKWDWNNVIYQPGQYASYEGGYDDTSLDEEPGEYHWYDLYRADFFLTCSESATKTITFNRSFGDGSPAVDSTVSLYRYYSISDRYELIKTSALLASASSVTFNNLYSGQYAIKQALPAHYYDNASATCDGITGQCFQADLTSTSSASLTATNSKESQKTITVGSLTGGTITPNVTQAYAGDTVSLTVSPNTDWRLKADTLRYRDGIGTNVIISGTSFVMPDSDVTISAQFEPKRSVAVAALTGGTITPNTALAFPGDTVSLTVTPDTNKQLKAGSLKYTDDTGDHTISSTNFVMPESDVTVSADFEPRQYNISVAALTGGSITPDKATAASGETVTLTVTPDSGMQLKPGTLQYAYGSTTVPITGTSFEMPQSDLTVSAEFEIPVSIITAALPEGMAGNPYTATVTAQDGSPGYTWSAEDLPDGLVIDSATGEISGTPTEAGYFVVELTVTDTGGTQAHKTLTLYINERCGNGSYRITPEDNAAYTWAYGDGGLPVMTISSGATGFKYLTVSIQKEKGHEGREVLLFVHMRDGKQIGINATLADFDSLTTGCAAFNVKPGDRIMVYIVDMISNDTDSNPVIQ